MRLTCPNCATEYEVPESMIGPSGTHVQCTACHTRWFVSPPGSTKLLSEDQIIARLETRSPRPRPVVVAARDEPATGPAADAPDPARDGGSDFVWHSPELRPEPTPGAMPPPPVAPVEPPPAPEAPPAGTPPAARPAAAPRSEPSRDATAERRRAGSRLEVTSAPRAAEPPEPPSQSRFGFGMLVALALGEAALALYLFADPLAAEAPTLAPTIETYVELVDTARARIEALRPDVPA